MQTLHTRAVWLFFISFLLRSIFPAIILFFWGFGFWQSVQLNQKEISGDFFNWLWLVIPLYLIFCFGWAKLTYHFYRYELPEAGFRKESGVIYKKYVTIPYDRIQNVDIYRGIWARILGLSDLQIQTAGASASVSRYGAWGIGAEGRLPGLSKDVAEKLRDELINHTRNKTKQGL